MNIETFMKTKISFFIAFEIVSLKYLILRTINFYIFLKLDHFVSDLKIFEIAGRFFKVASIRFSHCGPELIAN